MKYIISVLSLLIFIGLIIFYFQLSKPEITVKKVENQKNETIKKEDFFNIKKPNVFFLPARILYMKIDFQKFRYEVIYKVTIKNVDKFALFNIKTILDNNKIPYSLFKAKKTEIYIFFKNLNEASSVLSLFKEYNFNIKIEKIKKRI